jgi:8-oxo-dGTP pyrophosphatase MutT (NUDIX family)
MTSRSGQLAAELLAYAPADERERAHHRALLDLLAGGGDPFSRAHFAPGHVTASCFIVDGARDALLLHRHRRLGRWLQMGGHLDGDETPRDAALREGREESGLRDLTLLTESIFDVDVHSIPAARGEPDHFHFDVRYLAATAMPSQIAIDRRESDDLAWIALHVAERLMDEEASSRVIRKIRSLW